MDKFRHLTLLFVAIILLTISNIASAGEPAIENGIAWLTSPRLKKDIGEKNKKPIITRLWIPVLLHLPSNT